MARSGDVVLRRAARAHRGTLLSAPPPPLAEWLTATLGAAPGDLALYERALTHGSVEGAGDYQRLEFVGDRVLGLSVARMLYDRMPREPEGSLSKRLAMLVSGATCAEVGRALGVPPHIRLGKQARDDGARDSVNVIGDVVEALIGALHLDHGFEAAERFVRRAWDDRLSATPPVPHHPKSALQEWAAASRRRPPDYRLVERSGPGHAPRFVVAVAVNGAGEAQAEGRSKQEAETAAAAALLRLLRLLGAG